MVKFLINRPIAVTMTFVAILVLGIVALYYIPVSLMPDIDIPEITVQINAKNTSARELENSVVKPIRRQLAQVAHLADIKSETRNENSIIHLKFDYGTDVDFAFIEVNEKIDRAMNYLPREIQRPKVIKASATDIPVFYLNLTVKNPITKSNYSNNQTTKQPNTKLFPVSQKFVELSRFASNVIRKRIEQLPEVAMVDISGLVYSELLILPNNNKLESLGITLEVLEDIIKNNNIKLGNLLIRDGQYQYNIRFSSALQNKRDIENIYFKVEGRLFQLKDIAEVIEHPQKQKGKVLFNGEDAITMAVIKQSDAQLADLKNKLTDLISYFEADYPHIGFNVTRNQTKLLDYSIANLSQSLIWGACLSFLIMFLFLKDFRSPLLIGITIPSSLIISLLFFYIFNISINIISLSGIILGVGMMIDNSIIVIDNIAQNRERSKLSNLQSLKHSNIQILDNACIKGTNEVFRPMLSSVLTTCAVFIPLIFISGIAGALFYDQAMAIAIGLLVSLAVSITLLPVYYKLVYRRGAVSGENRFLRRLNKINYETIYEKGFRWIMKRQIIAWILVIFLLIGGIILYKHLDKAKLPVIAKDEIILTIDWNENIHIDENSQRIKDLLQIINTYIVQNTSLIGEQQFILDKNSSTASSEVIMYLKAPNEQALDSAMKQAGTYLKDSYPQSNFTFTEAGNIFNLLFSDEEKPLTAKLRAVNDQGQANTSMLLNTIDKLQLLFTEQEIEPPSLYRYTILNTIPEQLMLYDVSYETVYRKLKSAFNENQVFLIADNQEFVPVVLGGEADNIHSVINELFIRNKKNKLIPIRSLLTETYQQDLKTIVAGQEGEYYPVDFGIEESKANQLMDNIRESIQANKHYEVSFSGSIFSNKKLMSELIIILLISLTLLYFILASQFESLTLPLIVLFEVPIDVFGAFLALKIGGASINLMSLIGIVVMSGIIINDSILKIDTINQLRNEGYSLMRALIVAGQRRLKPILMTSLTTILALVPFLFAKGLGADLQKPLALAVIGGMSIGTLVSLYFIPLCYYYLKRNKTKN